MSDRTISGQAFAGLLFLFLAITTAVPAQEPDGEVAETPDAVNASFAQIETDITEYFRLEAELAEVEPGYQRLVRSRLDEREREIFEQVDAFAANLAKIAKRGEPIDKYRAQVVDWLKALGTRANAFLDRNRQIIFELLETQSGIDPTKAAEAVVDLDRAIEREIGDSDFKCQATKAPGT